MKLLKKLAAGMLIAFGSLGFLLALVILFSPTDTPGATEAKKPGYDTSIIIALVFGLSPTAAGVWLLRSVAKQNQTEEQQRLNAAFFQVVREGKGHVNLLNFVMTANCSADTARQFLDERAREFNATFDVDDEGGVLYYFNILETTSNAEGAEPAIVPFETPAAVLEPTDSHRASNPPTNNDWVTLILETCPPRQKIETIKIIRESTGLGLKESKNLVETVPSVVMRTNRSKAELIKSKLEAIGATARLQNS